MVARYDEDGHAAGRDPRDGPERPLHQRRRDAAPVEEIAAVNHGVDLATQGGRQRQLEVPQEVGTAPPSLDAGVRRIIEP